MLKADEIRVFRVLVESQDIKDILKDMFENLGFAEYQRFAKYSLDTGLISSDKLMSIIEPKKEKKTRF